MRGFMFQVILVFFEGTQREIAVKLGFLTVGVIVTLIKTNGQRSYQRANSSGKRTCACKNGSDVKR